MTYEGETELLEAFSPVRIEGEPRQLVEFVVELARLAGTGGTVNNYLLSNPVDDGAGFGIGPAFEADRPGPRAPGRFASRA